MTKVVGILALQGSFIEHQNKLKGSILIKVASQLSEIDALVIPGESVLTLGGESTVIYQLLDSLDFIHPLLEFAKSNVIYGTCAGLIILQKLGLLNISVQRNGYGSQKFSFVADVYINEKINVSRKCIPGYFIRAPRISSIESNVEVVATREMEIVAVRQGNILASCFHPELDQGSSPFYEILMEMLEKL